MLLVTVADDRQGRKDGMYGPTQDKAEKIFRNNPEFGIDKFLMWKWEDIQRDPLYSVMSEQLDHKDPSKNGRVYKSLAVLRGLQSIERGEYLVYSDVSPDIWKMDDDYKIPKEYDINILKGLCDKNKGILAALVIWDNRPVKDGEYGIHTHENFTLNLCMRTMGLEKFAKSFMPASGMIVIKRTHETEELIFDWFKWCAKSECSAFGPFATNDYSYWDAEQFTKLGGRHDQSVLGLLMCRDGYQLVIPPSPALPYSHNPLTYARKGVEYKFMNPNENPSTERRIRKGDKVVNTAGEEMTVWEIRAHEQLIVGKHPESAYATYPDKVTLL